MIVPTRRLIIITWTKLRHTKSVSLSVLRLSVSRLILCQYLSRSEVIVVLTRCRGHRASRGPCQMPAAAGTQACQTGSGHQSAAAAPPPSCSSKHSTSPSSLRLGCPDLQNTQEVRGHTLTGGHKPNFRTVLLSGLEEAA